MAGIIADCTCDAPVYIYPIRILNDSGRGNVSNAVNAINESIEKGVDVINLSLVGTKILSALDDAVLEAVEAGVTVVGAAGNSNMDTKNCSPCHLEEMIVVGSVEESGEKSSYSNYGESVDVYCCGSQIYGATKDGGYGYNSGTSFSAPHVSGLCGLLLMVHNELSPTEVDDRIKAATDDRRVVDCTMMVPQGMRFSLDELELCIGERIGMPIEAVPLSCMEEVTYESTDENVCLVDGRDIRAVGPGECSIRATCMGIEESFRVLVVDDEGGIFILPKCIRAVEEGAFDDCNVRIVVGDFDLGQGVVIGTAGEYPYIEGEWHSW